MAWRGYALAYPFQGELMEIALLLGLAFVANKVVAVIKSLASSDRNAAVTQVLVWAVAFAAMVWAASAEISEALLLPGMTQPLGELDLPSLGLLSLIAGSTGSVVFDFRKAFDNTDSAVEPRLLGDYSNQDQPVE